MKAKLTLKQKAANKAVQKIRDKAFAARRHGYRTAMEAAMKIVDSGYFAKQAQAADEAWNCELRARQDAIAAIDCQIEELKERRDRVKAGYELSLQPKRMARDEAWDAFRAHKNEVEQRVNAQFPDIANIWYVSQWKPPTDVQAQMDAAREEALQ